jgi:aminoglycoside 3-N-acetyltransferase
MSTPEAGYFSRGLAAPTGTLYVRAALKPLGRQIKLAGGVVPFLHQRVDFDELVVPHFYGARPFWRPAPAHWPPETNSGALGKQVAALPGAVLSQHPTHAFAGVGPTVGKVLAQHGPSQWSFEPLGALADNSDFSMLLLGCVDESPGFSTVHVAQQRLGLSQRHLLRLLLRWDQPTTRGLRSSMAREAPGCSASFDKFYPYYEADGNLVRGNWHGVSWLFVPSARRALQTETALLRQRGRFVDCGRWNCPSCRLRWY